MNQDDEGGISSPIRYLPTAVSRRMPIPFARSLRVRILASLLGGCCCAGWPNEMAFSQEVGLPLPIQLDPSGAYGSNSAVTNLGAPLSTSGVASTYRSTPEDLGSPEHARVHRARPFVEALPDEGLGSDAGSIDETGLLVDVPESGVTIPEWIDMAKLKSIDGREVGVVSEFGPDFGDDFDDDMGGQFELGPMPTRYRIYREHASLQSYMPGDGDQFGWIDLETSPYLHGNQKSGWTTAVGLHLLSGPNAAPLPPRLWDFVLGYQKRETIADRFSYDLAGSVGVYSDFEDSARDGVRTLGHAVGMFHSTEALDIVAGVDYLDRDDYKILPVIGFSWHGSRFPNLGVDLVFPRPRVQVALSSTERVYMAGLLGGGTWDIEMPGDINDVMTYRDFRILFGHEQLTSKGNVAALELGVVFGRKLEFRSLRPDLEFDDAFIIRLVSSH